MSQEKSYDTSIRVSKIIKDEVNNLKDILNITSDDKRFCLEDTIRYAIRYTLENDKSIEKVREEIMYAVHRGRVYLLDK